MRECPRWADVVRGHGIADLDQHPRAVDRFDGSWFGLDPLEEGRESDIGRGVVPAIQRPCLAGDGVPTGLTEDVLVATLEHLRVNHPVDCRTDLGVAGPDVRQHHGLARGSVADGVVREIDVQVSGEGIGNHQRGASEVVRLDLLVNPALEVPVPREYAPYDEVGLVHRSLDLLVEGARVADAGGAPVADDAESESV